MEAEFIFWSRYTTWSSLWENFSSTAALQGHNIYSRYVYSKQPDWETKQKIIKCLVQKWLSLTRLERHRQMWAKHTEQAQHPLLLQPPRNSQHSIHLTLCYNTLLQGGRKEHIHQPQNFFWSQSSQTFPRQSITFPRTSSSGQDWASSQSHITSGQS